MLLPHHLGRLAIKDYQFPQHLRDIEREILTLIYTNKFNRLAISIPINTGKSYEMILVAAWYLLRWPEREIILATHGKDFSELTSWRIRQLLERCNWPFDKAFRGKGSFRSQFGGGLHSCGVGGGIAGRRADLLLMDDLNKSDATSKKVSKTLFDIFFGEIMSRLRDSTSKAILIGSRRAESDVIGQVTRDNQDLPKDRQWRIINRPALNAKEESIWPERFSSEYFKGWRDELAIKGLTWQWASLFQNCPTGDPTLTRWDSRFIGDWLFYDYLPEVVNDKIVVVDPALGRSDTACMGAALVMCLDKSRHIWVEDGVLEVIPLEILEDRVVELNARYHPLATLVEANGQFELAADNIVRKLGLAGLRNNVAVKDSVGSKVGRIEITIGPLLRSRQLHIKRNSVGKILYQQIKEFPSGMYIDGPDALCLGIQMLADM